MEDMIKYDEFYKIKRDVDKERIDKGKQDAQMELEEFILFGCKCTG